MEPAPDPLDHLRYAWNEILKPSLAITVPKQLVVKDWRLGLLNLALTVLVISGSLVLVFRQGTFLETEVPLGDANPNMFFDPTDYNEYLAEITKQGSSALPAYCTSPDDYAYFYSSAYNYKAPKCVTFAPEELALKGYKSLFITTAIYETRVLEFEKQPGKACDDTLAEIAENSKEYDVLTEVLNVCRYSKRQSIFALGAEKARAHLLEHQYYVDFVSGGKVTGSNPETYVRVPGSENNLVKFEDSNEFGLTLEQMLNFTNIDLDADVLRNAQAIDESETARGEFARAQQGPSQRGSGKYPRTRLTGTDLVLRLKYYNHGFGDAGLSSGRLDSKVRCIAELIARPRWTTLGSQPTEYLRDASDPLLIEQRGESTVKQSTHANGVRTRLLLDKYRHGVRISIEVVGILGSANYNAMLNAIVQALVFLGFVQTVMNLIVNYGMGIKSQVYRPMVMQELNFQKNLGTFATKAFVANEVFNNIDIDRTGSVSLYEIFNGLKSADPELETREAAALAALMMVVTEYEKKATTVEHIDAKMVSNLQLHKDDFVKMFAPEVDNSIIRKVVEKNVISISDDVLALVEKQRRASEAAMGASASARDIALREIGSRP